MSKLKEDFRVAMLGAAGGLFASSVFLLVSRVDAYYTYLSRLELSDDMYRSGVEDLWWIPISFWHVLLSVIASLLVHRYLQTHRKSPFLIWQSIGTVTLLAWGVTFGIALSLSCLMTGSTSSVENELSRIDAAHLAKYVSAVFACNVLYGSAVQAASRQYIEDCSSLSADCPVGYSSSSERSEISSGIA